MESLFISVFLVIIFLVLGVLLIKSFLLKTDTLNAHITIYADEGEKYLEKTIIAAKLISEKYLKGATVYVSGGDDEYVNKLCKRYNILRK